MALPEHTRVVVERRLSSYCEDRIPLRVRNQVRLGVRFRGHRVTLFEERPGFRDPDRWTESVIAQFRMDKETFEWGLYWADRNSKWLLHEAFAPTRDFDAALREVDSNPYGIFWG
jgi:hypothetical protein